MQCLCVMFQNRWCLIPRVLRDVSKLDLSVSVMGQRLSMPVCVAATAMQRMAHPDGETATARGKLHLHKQTSKQKQIHTQNILGKF